MSDLDLFGSVRPEGVAPVVRDANVNAGIGDLTKLREQKPKQRKKYVNHNPRTKDWITAQGYEAARVDRTVHGRDGFIFTVDYLGLFDFEGRSPDKPRLLVQTTSSANVRQRVRKMCSDKKAHDNKKPLVDNLRHCLAMGERCIVLGWDKPGPRWVPVVLEITEAEIEATVGRRKH